ncbi:MAG: hypothetical protein F4X09_04715 [Gammaproteobacteria bacterium]|nr:hypothetical protein [Gammaproteobacteria bacterium]MYC59483.1 hypothetical protein [Gammaproteobacteria bacterium]MYG96543.1 hypothetical protein [Gammaproteobacteria bacterium]
MSVVNFLLSNAPIAVIVLLAVLYLQNQMNRIHLSLLAKMDKDHSQLQKAVSELSERVARLEGVGST